MAYKGVAKEEKPMNTEIRRQLVHASGILAIVPIYYLGKERSLLLLGAFLFLLLAMSNFRGKLFLLRSLENFVKKFERTKESPIRGALTFLSGCFIAVLVFPVELAIAGISVLAVSDSLSTVVGMSYGKHKVDFAPKKSWEGTGAFFLSALFVLLYFMGWEKALLVAFLASLIELIPHWDDNVVLPSAVALLIQLL